MVILVLVPDLFSEAVRTIVRDALTSFGVLELRPLILGWPDGEPIGGLFQPLIISIVSVLGQGRDRFSRFDVEIRTSSSETLYSLFEVYNPILFFGEVLVQDFEHGFFIDDLELRFEELAEAFFTPIGSKKRCIPEARNGVTS